MRGTDTEKIERARIATLALCAEVHVERLRREADVLSADGQRELHLLRRDVSDLARALGSTFAGGPVADARETR